jgi:ubiquinone/menaquinone biosynthesis C-methylase UbiE
MSSNDKSGSLEEQVRKVAQPWISSPYYEGAERYTHVFWGEGRIFRRLFNQLDLASVVELSCGHGRHAERVAPLARKLTLIDIVPENIEFCRKRLRPHANVEYLVGDGHSFAGVSRCSVSAIYCYDSMVHFTPDIVKSYLVDARRVLVPGGKALFHHSNFLAPFDKHYGQNPHARNHMTKDLFAYYSALAELEILESTIIDWSDAKSLDCVSLLRAPDRV